MNTNQQYEIEYIGGHPDLIYPGKISLKVIPENNNILLKELSFRVNSKKILIDKEEIISIDLEDKQTRSYGKAAAGAIIGGLLTGGIGLLAGGAIGAQKKDASNIYITIDYDGKPFKVIFKAGKFTKQIYSELCNLFSA